jgi:tetrachlorobenzoquinone reductase
MATVTKTLSLIVTAVRAEALDVLSVELRDPKGAALPPFTPGAHLELDIVSVPGRPPLVRHYSLSNDSRETDRYVVAVARAPNGRGGSAAMHDFIRVGSAVSARGPRNNFPLDKSADFHRFIAGGIGITPVLSMIHWCVANDKQWSLLYSARSKNRAAFFELLRAFGNNVRFHFDDEHQGSASDLGAELSSPLRGEHVYCCGPAPLMEAVRTICSDRDPDTVHFEWFSAESSSVSSVEAGEFEIILRRKGLRLPVPKDRSILHVLENHGVVVSNSCREGVCGSCETTVCAGQVDHRDHVLTKSEKALNQTMMVCVSRAISDTLELDL